MSTANYRQACTHLKRNDPVMRTIIERVGPCLWAPQFDEPLALLVRCVVSQQISTKAAESIYARLMEKLKGPPVKLTRLARLTSEDYRACGISGPKQRTLQAIITHVQEDKTFLQRLPELPDEDFRVAVTAIKGLGPWSADMLLMFGLARPDVLPVGDYGIKVAIQTQYALLQLPTPEEMHTVARPWQPYRSVASWYLWRTLEWKKSAKT